MKRIINIIAAISIFFTSCNQDNVGADATLDADQGVVELHYSLTKSEVDDTLADELLASSTLKIYKENGDLIRYYSPATEAPSELYLIAGSYSATFVAGEKSYITTSLSDCSYYGKVDFDVVAGESRTIDLSANLDNIAVKVVYDQSVASNFEPGFITYVSASDSFSEQTAKEDELYTLSFTESGTGYFILPEGVSNLSWGFLGTNLDSDLGYMVASGAIKAPQSAGMYTLTMKYSSVEGGIDIHIDIDDSAEEHEDDFNFSPQPTISGRGFDALQTQAYLGGDVIFDITSINALTNIELEAIDTNGDVVGSFQPFVGGAAEDLSEQGVVYDVESSKNGSIILSDKFFEHYNLGGSKGIKITAIDSYGAKSVVTTCYMVSGLLGSEVDSWHNCATLTACVADVDSDNVVLSYRKSGDTQWIDLPTKRYDIWYCRATILPTWEKSTNPVGDPIYTLVDGIRAGNSYEYRCSVGDAESHESTFDVLGVQVIPDANMENSELSCWGQSNSNSAFWGSGNNSMSGSLCKQGEYAGMGGAKCAQLSGTSVTMVKLAAGNLFAGCFERPGLTSGKVSFGQKFDWEGRPTKFKFKYAASIGTIDAKYHDGAPVNTGDKDIARVFFAIVDWDSRHGVTSGVSAPSGVWDPETMTEVTPGNKIIGYASQYITTSTTGDMIESELDVHYYDPNTKPSKNITIVISCATSAYGDYMTGSTSSKLYVDDFEFGY